MSQVSKARTPDDRPRCENCDLLMWLLNIKPADHGQELRTYECARCAAGQTVLVKMDVKPDYETDSAADAIAQGRTCDQNDFGSGEPVPEIDQQDVPSVKDDAVNASANGEPVPEIDQQDAPNIKDDPPMPTDPDELREWAKTYFGSDKRDECPS